MWGRWAVARWSLRGRTDDQVPVVMDPSSPIDRVAHPCQACGSRSSPDGGQGLVSRQADVVRPSTFDQQQDPLWLQQLCPATQRHCRVRHCPQHVSAEDDVIGGRRQRRAVCVALKKPDMWATCGLRLCTSDHLRREVESVNDVPAVGEPHRRGARVAPEVGDAPGASGNFSMSRRSQAERTVSSERPWSGASSKVSVSAFYTATASDDMSATEGSTFHVGSCRGQLTRGALAGCNGRVVNPGATGCSRPGRGTMRHALRSVTPRCRVHPAPCPRSG